MQRDAASPFMMPLTHSFLFSGDCLQGHEEGGWPDRGSKEG
jgi:hypothetical protein